MNQEEEVMKDKLHDFEQKKLRERKQDEEVGKGETMNNERHTRID